MSGQDELQWTAFCYVLDELSSEARDSFEQRMLSDQQAREAVAEAVSLSSAIAGGVPSRPMVAVAAKKGERAFAFSGIPWLATACSLAVVLAIGLAWLQIFQPPVRPASSLTAQVDAVVWTPELASQWIAVAQQFPVEEPLLEETDSLVEAEISASVDESFRAPQWMIAAINSFDAQHGELEY